MTTQLDQDRYAEQLTRIARALAIAQVNAVASELAIGQPATRLKMFTDGNLEKRFEKLVDQVDVLADEFEDLSELIEQYVKTVPLSAYDCGSSDGDRFVQWLVRRRPLNPEQCDAVTIVRARHAVEERGRKYRTAHIRFQEITTISQELSTNLQHDVKLQLHLNPIHQWAVFESRRYLTEEDELPADVLFYASGNEVRTAILDAFGRAVVRSLRELGPCSLRRLQRQLMEADLQSLTRRELLQLLPDFLEVGLIALG